MSVLYCYECPRYLIPSLCKPLTKRPDGVITLPLPYPNLCTLFIWNKNKVFDGKLYTSGTIQQVQSQKNTCFTPIIYITKVTYKDF